MHLMLTVILLLAFSAPSLGSNTIAEDAGLFTVNIANVTNPMVNVTVSGSATPGVDYIPPPEQITLPFDVPIVNDPVNEEPETIDLRVETDAGIFTISYVIEDNDPVMIASTGTEFVEGETATIDLICTFPPGSSSLVFSVEAEDGTAVSPDDYFFLTGFPFTCTNSAPTVSVVITLIDNSVHSPTRTFGLRVVTDFTVSGDTNLTVSILDDDCAPPCENGGTCVSGICECPPGFTGTYCDLLDCAPPCENGGTCVSGICQCPPGFTGTYCDLLDCAPPCENGGTCVSGICQCPPGFTGTYCDLLDCAPPCENGGTCVSGICQCPPGFTGTYCDLLDCAPPCENGGTCVSGICQCPPGFTGTYCDLLDCAPPCENGGTCVSGICQCPPGFTGTYCDLLDCAQPCENGGTCVSGICECPPGFTGTYCDLLDCAQPCENGGTCVSGSCQCPTGYTGNYCESVDCSS